MMNLTDFRMLVRALNEHPSCKAKTEILSSEKFEDEDRHLGAFVSEIEWRSQHWEVLCNSCRACEVSNRLLHPLEGELEIAIQEERKDAIAGQR